MPSGVSNHLEFMKYYLNMVISIKELLSHVDHLWLFKDLRFYYRKYLWHRTVLTNEKNLQLLLSKIRNEKPIQRK